MVCGCKFCKLGRYFFFLTEEFFLISTLHNINEDKDGNHKVEGALAHVLNGMAPEADVGELTTFGNEEDTHDEKNKEPEHLVEPVLLQET